MGKRAERAAAPASDSAAVDTDAKTSKKAKLSAIADAAVDTVASSVGSGKLLPVKFPALGPSPPPRMVFMPCEEVAEASANLALYANDSAYLLAFASIISKFSLR